MDSIEGYCGTLHHGKTTISFSIDAVRTVCFLVSKSGALGAMNTAREPAAAKCRATEVV